MVEADIVIPQEYLKLDLAVTLLGKKLSFFIIGRIISWLFNAAIRRNKCLNLKCPQLFLTKSGQGLDFPEKTSTAPPHLK